MNRFAAASAAVAVALLSAGTASASEYRIRIGDLDLSTPQGASAFDRRVIGVANTACVAGTPLDQARCRRDFRIEALERLPVAHREDYARARDVRIVVRTPADQS
ncbi:UrcA family protein [Brevundimonas sp.]